MNAPEVLSAVGTVIVNPAHPSFANLVKWAGEQAYGKPNQPVNLTQVDLTKLTDEQVQRIADGEDPAVVLATSSPR